MNSKLNKKKKDKELPIHKVVMVGSGGVGTIEF